MPGANSRFTGSATMRNSFTPSFIVHGSVLPLGVTTGVYGPAGGGAAVAAAGVCAGGVASTEEREPARQERPERRGCFDD